MSTALLTTRQVADHLGESEVHVRRRIRRGELAAINTSGNPNRPRYRVHPDALKAWIAAHAA
ncbi:helix-turn-helix domain-containing protein [Yimella sp. cx-573]|nr:helix-turn-helix domain-containing protein [Yimella sp. cx-573]